MTENFRLEQGRVYRCLELVPVTEIDRLASMSESTHNSGKSLEPGSIFSVDFVWLEGRGDANIAILVGQVTGQHAGISTGEFEISPRDFHRCAAVPDAEAIPLLEQLVQESPHGATVRIAIVALGTCGATASVPLLVQSVRRPEDYIRTAAVVALGMVSDRSSLPLLESFQNDPGRGSLGLHRAQVGRRTGR